MRKICQTLISKYTVGYPRNYLKVQEYPENLISFLQCAFIIKKQRRVYVHVSYRDSRFDSRK